MWREAWKTDLPVNFAIIKDPTAVVPGFDLPRREWRLLDRFRFDTGRSADCR